ncbi:MAG: hypothetical protein KatS3mg111_1922 [Pirellulaceae bacterium]|nr:MAG: hypothetical protein KatS3mg111_1922 [Pirellulaceae bacterium]
MTHDNLNPIATAQWLESLRREQSEEHGEQNQPQTAPSTTSSPEILQQLGLLLDAADASARDPSSTTTPEPSCVPPASSSWSPPPDSSPTTSLTHLEECLKTLPTEIAQHTAKAILEPLARPLLQITDLCEELREQIASLTSASSAPPPSTTVDETSAGEDNDALILHHLRQASAGYEQRDEELLAIKEQLEAALREIEDLKQQNTDLASQLAKAQVSQSGHHSHINFDAESLPWEERKKRILAQLEADEEDVESDEAPEAASQREETRLEVERIVALTDREIQRRDREIAELRMLVEQQAEAHQGVAVGAAAVAQMLESDALIVEERRKLQEIQQQWEEKLRQAEIDLSMERAKLARQRRELEAEREQLRNQLEVLEKSATTPTGRRRRWLDHLGLGDDGSAQ